METRIDKELRVQFQSKNSRQINFLMNLLEDARKLYDQLMFCLLHRIGARGTVPLDKRDATHEVMIVKTFINVNTLRKLITRVEKISGSGQPAGEYSAFLLLDYLKKYTMLDQFKKSRGKQTITNNQVRTWMVSSYGSHSRQLSSNIITGNTRKNTPNNRKALNTSGNKTSNRVTNSAPTNTPKRNKNNRNREVPLQARRKSPPNSWNNGTYN